MKVKELVAKRSTIEAFGNFFQAIGNTALFNNELLKKAVIVGNKR
ncbi:hypothetical protein MKX62_18015 [Sporosarcina sp. FSL K6-5500]